MNFALCLKDIGCNYPPACGDLNSMCCQPCCPPYSPPGYVAYMAEKYAYCILKSICRNVVAEYNREEALKRISIKNDAGGKRKKKGNGKSKSKKNGTYDSDDSHSFDENKRRKFKRSKKEGKGGRCGRGGKGEARESDDESNAGGRKNKNRKGGPSGRGGRGGKGAREGREDDNGESGGGKNKRGRSGRSGKSHSESENEYEKSKMKGKKFNRKEYFVGEDDSDCDNDQMDQKKSKGRNLGRDDNDEKDTKRKKKYGEEDNNNIEERGGYGRGGDRSKSKGGFRSDCEENESDSYDDSQKKNKRDNYVPKSSYDHNKKYSHKFSTMVSDEKLCSDKGWNNNKGVCNCNKNYCHERETWDRNKTMSKVEPSDRKKTCGEMNILTKKKQDNCVPISSYDHNEKYSEECSTSVSDEELCSDKSWNCNKGVCNCNKNYCHERETWDRNKTMSKIEPFDRNGSGAEMNLLSKNNREIPLIADVRMRVKNGEDICFGKGSFCKALQKGDVYIKRIFLDKSHGKISSFF